MNKLHKQKTKMNSHVTLHIIDNLENVQAFDELLVP